MFPQFFLFPFFPQIQPYSIITQLRKETFKKREKGEKGNKREKSIIGLINMNHMVLINVVLHIINAFFFQCNHIHANITTFVCFVVLVYTHFTQVLVINQSFSHHSFTN